MGVCDAVVEGIDPLKQRSQCVDHGAQKGEDNRFAHREISTELRAYGEGDHVIEAQFVERLPKEVSHVNDLLRGRGSGAGSGGGHCGSRERESLRDPMGGHFCSSQRVLGVVQLTESARGGSSLRVQNIVRFCTRSKVVLRNVGVGR